MDEEIYYIWLSQMKNRYKRKMLESFVSIREMYDNVQYSDKEQDFDKAIHIMKKCEKHDIRVLTYDKMDLLNGLSSISNRPIVLYYKGRIIRKTSNVAVVGARRCTREGRDRTLSLTTELVEADKTIISGMAKGIDSYAHTMALMLGGYTIAVLGCGLDICYPKEHDKLMTRIASEGLLLSEYPPGTPPVNYNFPKRNRIIAALSDEIFVVEAGKNSGALITAEYGEKYGRTVHIY